MTEMNHTPMSCELDDTNGNRQRVRGPGQVSSTESRIHRFRDGYTWDGVEVQPYKTLGDETNRSGDWADAVRQVLIGMAGEPTDFHLRYFEIAAGGYTSLEKHEHAHVIIAVRGTGKVIAGHHCWEVSFLDAVYIAPDTPHQLVNSGAEPFGFFCVVDAVRDHPQPLSEWEREHIMQNEEVRKAARL